MQEYVQKSTSTTLPRSFSIVSGSVLIQFERPVNSGAGPKSLSDELVAGSRVLPPSFRARFWAPIVSARRCFWSDSV